MSRKYSNNILKVNEHQLQVAVIQWCQWNANLDFRLRYIFAIPNGGQRNILVAQKLKAEGVSAGVPDLFLSYPCGDFHGLYIEMKSIAGKQSTKQKEWQIRLEAAGYKYLLAFSHVEAINGIKSYLNLDQANKLSDIKVST